MVKKLVLIDPAGMMPRPSFPASALNIPIIGEIMLDLFGNQLLVQGNAKDMLHPEAFPEYTTLYQPQMTYSGFRRAVLSTFRDGMLHSKGEAYQRVGKLALPILIVWGKEDQVIPLSISDWFQKTLPNAVFKIIEQAGHVPQYELPDVVNPILIDFIRADTFQS